MPCNQPTRAAAIAFTISLSLAFASTALASQGPGTLPGTATPFMQMAMAVVIYGACAAVIITGVIGAFRR